MIPIIEHDAVARIAHRLPPLPQSAARLLALTASDRGDLREVIQVVEFDPVLTMKLLRMANSIAGGSAQTVGNVRDAVVRLGTRTVSDLALAASVQPLLAKTIPGYHISGAQFWKHSLAAALVPELLQGTHRAIPAMGFAAALLHDIGKLVLGQLLNPTITKLLEQAQRDGDQDAFQAEMEILNMHHGEVGGIVAQHWLLPQSIVDGIIHHHDPEEIPEAMCCVTCLANCVAHAVADPDASTSEVPRATAPLDFALRALGLSPLDYTKLCRAVADRLETVTAAYPT